MLEEILNRYVEDKKKHKVKRGSNYNVTDLLQCRAKLGFIREGETPEVNKDNDSYRQAILSTYLHRSIEEDLEKLGWITESMDVISFGVISPTPTKFTKRIEKIGYKCPWCGSNNMKLLLDELDMVECLDCGHKTDQYEAIKQKEKEDKPYELTMRADAVLYNKQDSILKKILEIKCPMYLSKRIPDSYLQQIGMYLNITNAEECILLILAKNGFREYIAKWNNMEQYYTIEGDVSKYNCRDEDIVWMIENPKSPFYDRECESCWYRVHCDKVK